MQEGDWWEFRWDDHGGPRFAFPAGRFERCSQPTQALLLPAPMEWNRWRERQVPEAVTQEIAATPAPRRCCF